MAKRPDDRPALDDRSDRALAGVEAPARRRHGEGSEPPPKSRPELMVFNETPLKRAGPPKTEGRTVDLRPPRGTRGHGHQSRAEPRRPGDGGALGPAARSRSNQRATMMEPLQFGKAMPALRGRPRSSRPTLLVALAAAATGSGGVRGVLVLTSSACRHGDREPAAGLRARVRVRTRSPFRLRRRRPEDGEQDDL